MAARQALENIHPRVRGPARPDAQVPEHLEIDGLTWRPEMLEACVNCRYAMPLGKGREGHEGSYEFPDVECHFHAPRTGHKDFPVMRGEDWCGQFMHNGIEWSWE